MTTKESGDSRGRYVRRVQEETQKYLQDLLAENARLRETAAAAEAERARLREEASRLGEELQGRRREEERLQTRMAEIETENERFAREYLEVEQRNSNLANLYVASYRLHGTLERGEVLSIIQEILINLVGSEEIGLFELHRNSTELRLVSSFGIDADRYASVPLGAGIIGNAAVTGDTYVAGMPLPESLLPGEPWLTAAIPLRLPDRVMGVIAVFRLLEQKPGLGELDHEMFDLLATHAATALYCSSLHGEQGPRGEPR